MRYLSLMVFFLVSSSAFASGATGKGPCTDGSQCASGTCIEINSDSYCSQTCGSCPAGMYCDAKLFATMGIKVCVKGRATAPAKVQTPPRLPCRTDAQCEGALVCAQFMGRRDCTLPCATDAQCKPPAMMGIKMDFLGCSPDEGNQTRRACLPRKECISNPMSCMGVNAQQMMGMANQMMGMAQAMEGMGGADRGGDDETATQGPAAAPARPSYSMRAPQRTVRKKRQTTITLKSRSKAMSNSRFQAFLSNLKEQDFESERKDVISLVVKRNSFSCAQVIQVIKSLDFSGEQLSALRAMAPKIVDMDDSHLILSAFTFDSDKSKARKILNQ